MKLVTRLEAATLSTGKLRGLLQEAFNTAATAPIGSQERRAALASIQNIESILAIRSPCL